MLRTRRQKTRALEEITGEIVDAAYKVHTGLGPGLLESVDEAVLAQELARRGLTVERQTTICFEYDEMRFDEGLRLFHLPVWLLINFGAPTIKKEL